MSSLIFNFMHFFLNFLCVYFCKFLVKKWSIRQNCKISQPANFRNLRKFALQQCTVHSFIRCAIFSFCDIYFYYFYYYSYYLFKKCLSHTHTHTQTHIYIYIYIYIYKNFVVCEISQHATILPPDFVSSITF